MCDTKPGAILITGPDGQKCTTHGLKLGIEKFIKPYKSYRLIWFDEGSPLRAARAWQADEDRTPYKRKWGTGGAVEAVEALAERFEVNFSEVTR